MLEVKEMLKACYKMKDMGELHYCLGISIYQNKEERSIRNQYILNMLEKYGLTEAKIVATPADLNVRLQADDRVSKLVDQVTYQSMVGSVLYAAIATRPDISHAVGVVSKYIQLRAYRKSPNCCKENIALPEGNSKSCNHLRKVRRYTTVWIF
jgi:hypothetical protein